MKDPYHGMPWIVTAVKPLDNYCLLLDFIDKSRKIFDMKPYLDQGIFRALKNPALFRCVSLAGDSICWPGDIDIAPECLYENGVRC